VTPLVLSSDEARRFLVRRHLLTPPRSLPAESESVLAVVRRLGLLQFDPLEAPGARSHELVLHARIAGYQRGWCERWLYGPDRRLFEVYNKSLNIVPTAELPLYRLGWERSEARYRDGIFHEQAQVVGAVLERIRREGPLSTSDFAEHAHSVEWWWAPTRVARAVLEALFVSGRLGIARREGNRRLYELTERLLPARLLARREPEEVAIRHRLLSRFRALGMTAPSAPEEVMGGAGSAAERRRGTLALVEEGVLVEARVEGLRWPHYLLAEEVPLLEEGDAPAAVTFLSPQDPLVCDRGMLRDLWGFDYRWEVYVPEAKRRWGYYVLPLLFGHRLVGRIEPRFDRRRRRLEVVGLRFEEGFDPRTVPGFAEAFAEAVDAFAGFVGAEEVWWAPGTAEGLISGGNGLRFRTVRSGRRQAFPSSP
jgi:uncharacterized protein